MRGFAGVGVEGYRGKTEEWEINVIMRSSVVLNGLVAELADAAGEQSMNLTGHWNRAWEKPNHIETREGLLREEKTWEDALDHFADVVRGYVQAGGKVNHSRVSAFSTIVRLNLQELRSMREMRDILSSTTA